VLVLAIHSVLQVGPLTTASTPPTPTPTAVPPIYEEIGPELVDQFRIESVWSCGGSMTRCLHAESDPLILTRVAMGEAPHSLSDRVFVMWSIRLRAALGFKEALPGYLAVPDRWGPETSIAVEALCNGGCQYSPVRAAEGIYFPCEELDERHALRSMLCPTDDQLGDFYLTWTFATEIAFANLDQFPTDLRGFESFRSPSVSWISQINRPGGQRSIRFFPNGNIWRDEFPQDNVFWDEVDMLGLQLSLTATAEPSATATPVPTFPPATATWTPLAPRASVVPTQPAPVEAPRPGVSAGTILVLTGFSVLAVMVYTVAHFVRTKN